MYSLNERNINDILKTLRERTGIITSFLFTEDGFLIAIDQASFNEDEDYFQSIAAICAGVISLAENSLDIIKSNNLLKQIKIQAGNQLDDTGFMIILQSITKEILIAMIFPLYLNLGLILFELNQTINKLEEYFSTQLKTKNLEKITNSVKQL
ncbi:MAG: roadblock/LC7 domain-containing protein [Candidatus Thorarchaeota archaeon]